MPLLLFSVFYLFGFYFYAKLCYIRAQSIIVMENLKELYKKEYGCEPQSMVRLTGDGSNRVYYRMAGVADVMGAVGISAEENRAFVALSKAFITSGVNAPKVLAVSDDGLCYLQEDLGNETLYSALQDARSKGVFGAADVKLLCNVVSLLPRIQFGVAQHFDFSLCYPVSDFNERVIMWDLNYFKYCFLKGVGIEFNENRLEDEFERLTALLLSDNDNVFLYREPYFIDFQGGRRGPIYYDIASFVGQSRARYSEGAVSAMVDAYITALKEYRSVDREHFMQMLLLFRVFRLLQNLGAYGYRGLFERKKAFVESIPAALEQLDSLLGSDGVDFPYIQSLVREISHLPMFVCDDIKGLTVDVVSFSYKRGIPDDTSGNGGGFVFDCRAMPNPFWDESLRGFSGCDKPVVDFFEQHKDKVNCFLDAAEVLVRQSIEQYQKDGRELLMVAFGCTGGQHRSVYFAERMAERLAGIEGVEVVVAHAARKYWRVI